MTSNLGAETSLTNHDIFELDESNEDNMEEEVEANNENGTSNTSQENVEAEPRLVPLVFFFHFQLRSISSTMASTGAVPFWRAAGMTYITYSNICANLVRNCLKEPHKTEALSREKVHFSLSKWADGKPEKPTIRSDTPDH
ncbi:hypothetical protein P8452_54459 [Trifolium repens]|nr:hypothetical protein P8452_54459 [Trifolium repens]